MRKIFLIVFTLFLATLQIACQKYLETKPDKKMLLPEKLEDVEAILDNVAQLNMGASGLSEIGSDNHFLPINNFNALTLDEYREGYIWSKNPAYKLQWSSPYTVIYIANTALHALKDIKETNFFKKEELEGRALFFRAHSLFNIVQVFAKQYRDKKSELDLGAVLVESPDVNTAYRRATVAESYRFIIQDLERAITLIKSDREVYPTRPTKLAAEGLLALVYLQMSDYERAYAYADALLQRYDEVLDYQSVSMKRFPFEPFNEEVIFYNRMLVQTNLMPSNARISDDVFALFKDNDMRKKLFFSKNTDGSISFTGNYSAVESNTQFNGITVPEIMLVRAESAIRLGRLDEGRADLRKLAKYRYVDLSFSQTLDVDQISLIKIVLEERRRELFFRGRRWSDLRRCSRSELGVFELSRQLDKVYTISIEDLADFAYHIPFDVVMRGDVIQN
ncbi:RagB/SusD family nutrient uptake outer membrane protein [Sphingobacterium anhuiense]|uniref:RagB/SusD family nutrient uptake outer membrane protein n=1 Tax=Sphingobacterium anhuiense TaxID=493780 RepID=UPI003C2EBC6A